MISGENQPKIAFVIPSLTSGGAERVVSTLANGLCHKFDVLLITIADSRQFYELDNRIKILHLRKDPVKSSSIVKAIQNNRSLIRALKHALKQQQVELTIAFTTTANILTAIVCHKLNIPSIVSERSNPMARTLNRFWSVLRKRNYKNASKVVVQTNHIKEYYSEFVPTNKLVVLPNPLARELVTSRTLDSERENIILNVGRLDANKAQDVLIKAFSQIDNESWKLILVGSGDKEKDYKALVKDLQLESQVIFVGASSEVSDYYKKAKIFAFCSQAEGFPNVLIEAMYFQLACVSSDCDFGPSEIISNNENGFLFPVNDQTALQQKLESLMHDDELRDQFGKKAGERASQFEPDQIISQWEQLIMVVLSKT